MKNMIKRTLRTFFQAFVGFIATNAVLALKSGNADFEYIKTALVGVCVSAVAAGIAAIMNMPRDNGGK